MVAFVPQCEREVVVAPDLFRNRTELGEADAETGQPACAVAHRLPLRLPPRVAVLLEQVENLGLRHRTSLLTADPRQRATWQGSRTMVGSGDESTERKSFVLNRQPQPRVMEPARPLAAAGGRAAAGGLRPPAVAAAASAMIYSFRISHSGGASWTRRRSSGRGDRRR